MIRKVIKAKVNRVGARKEMLKEEEKEGRLKEAALIVEVHIGQGTVQKEKAKARALTVWMAMEPITMGQGSQVWS